MKTFNNALLKIRVHNLYIHIHIVYNIFVYRIVSNGNGAVTAVESAHSDDVENHLHVDGVTYEHTGHDHHVSRSFILMIALSLHHLFEGKM